MLLDAMTRTRRVGRALRRLRLSRVIDALDHRLARYRKHLGPFVPQGDAPVRYP
jgi:hypothetical protein